MPEIVLGSAIISVGKDRENVKISINDSFLKVPLQIMKKKQALRNEYKVRTLKKCIYIT